MTEQELVLIKNENGLLKLVDQLRYQEELRQSEARRLLEENKRLRRKLK